LSLDADQAFRRFFVERNPGLDFNSADGKNAAYSLRGCRFAQLRAIRRLE
jgi:hypothetical protein